MADRCAHKCVLLPVGTAAVARRLLYAWLMPHPSPPATITARLNHIRDVAHDLALELVRMRSIPPPSSAVHDMAVFIETEAEAALRALKKPRPSPRR